MKEKDYSDDLDDLDDLSRDLSDVRIVRQKEKKKKKRRKLRQGYVAIFSFAVHSRSSQNPAPPADVDKNKNTWKCGELKLYFSPSAGR